MSVIRLNLLMNNGFGAIVLIAKTLAGGVRRAPRRWSAPVVVSVTILCMAHAPAATADSDLAPGLRTALAAARQSTSCPALRSDPIVERVAEIANRSTDDYVDNAATEQPIDDPKPGLKTLGYGGTQAALLRAAAPFEADAIKYTLLEGLVRMDKTPFAISNCGYTDYGASVLYNESRGYYLTAIVLAGP